MIDKIHNSIANRYSELAFEPKSISKSDVDLLFEAARWAPSSYNEQPWRFYFASRDNKESFEKMLSILVPGNSEWAKDASLLIISTAQKHLSLNGNDNAYAKHDTGLATSNLLIQAESMGFATHVMGGFDREKARNILDFPESTIPVAAIAVGYHGDKSKLSEANIKRANVPRKRKPVNEIAVEI
jgi:nitroreductase